MSIFKKVVIFILGLIIIFFLTVLSIGYYISAPEYTGPVSDHFNGNQFTNYGNIREQGFLNLIKWMFTRDRGKWKKINDPPGPAPSPAPDKDSIIITFINHATMLIQVNGLNIITDPIWSKRASPFNWTGPERMRPPGINFEDLPPIDLVLISHNHYDHLDLPTVKMLRQEHAPQFIVPLGVRKFLVDHGIENVNQVEWWEEQAISNGISAICVPAVHFSGRGMFDRNGTLWAGYVIQSETGNIYFAGDTGYQDEVFKEIGKKFEINISLIPIGAYKPRWFMAPIHVSPGEALKIHEDVGSETSLAMHFGTFPLADDAMNDPVNDLRNILRAYDKEVDFRIPREGYPIIFH